jgi:Tfp pilus assembly protein PilO
MSSLKSKINWCTQVQYALLSGVAALVLIFYFGGYREENSRLSALNDQIAQARRDLAANTAQTQRLPAVVADINRLRSELADTKKLPKRLELGEFVRQITQLCQQRNLQKLECSLEGAPHNGEEYREQAMTLKFEGDFKDVFEFLREAEDMQRLTRVSTITIHEVDLLTGTVQVNLSLNLYFTEG